MNFRILVSIAHHPSSIPFIRICSSPVASYAAAVHISRRRFINNLLLIHFLTHCLLFLFLLLSYRLRESVDSFIPAVRKPIAGTRSPRKWRSYPNTLGLIRFRKTQQRHIASGDTVNRGRIILNFVFTLKLEYDPNSKRLI